MTTTWGGVGRDVHNGKDDEILAFICVHYLNLFFYAHGSCKAISMVHNIHEKYIFSTKPSIHPPIIGV